jgi:hypothetical protein
MIASSIYGVSTSFPPAVRSLRGYRRRRRGLLNSEQMHVWVDLGEDRNY